MFYSQRSSKMYSDFKIFFYESSGIAVTCHPVNPFHLLCSSSIFFFLLFKWDGVKQRINFSWKKTSFLTSFSKLSLRIMDSIEFWNWFILRLNVLLHHKFWDLIMKAEGNYIFQKLTIRLFFNLKMRISISNIKVVFFESVHPH